MRVALDRTSSSLAKIARSPDAPVPESFRENVRYMTEVFPRPGQVPGRYASVLEQSADLLEKIANGDVKTTEERWAILTDVSENVDVMVHASQPNVVGSVRPFRITVKVMKGDRELRGWEIFYMEYFLKHVRKDVGPDSFPQPSTATYDLPPGRYLLEGRDSHGVKTEQKACVVDRPLVCVLLTR
jgi:hypothetical protein